MHVRTVFYRPGTLDPSYRETIDTMHVSMYVCMCGCMYVQYSTVAFDLLSDHLACVYQCMYVGLYLCMYRISSPRFALLLEIKKELICEWLCRSILSGACDGEIIWRSRGFTNVSQALAHARAFLLHTRVSCACPLHKQNTRIACVLLAYN